MITSKDFMLCESITEKECLEKYTNVNSYIAQEKKDGERVMAIVQDGEVFLLNRRGKIINSHFKDIEQELKSFDNCILDGEICSNDDNFQTLQSRALTQNKFKQEQQLKTIPVTYWIFDILKIEGIDLIHTPLSNRIRELYQFLDGFKSEKVKILPYESVEESLKKAHEKDAEGIVVKYLNGYYEHKRSYNWLKCKRWLETTLILTTYTPNNAGIRCETDDKLPVQVSGIQHLEVKKLIDETGKAICNIQYLSKTKDGKMRFPSFRGLVNG